MGLIPYLVAFVLLAAMFALFAVNVLGSSERAGTFTMPPGQLPALADDEAFQLAPEEAAELDEVT